MTSTRPRLVILKGASAVDPQLIEALQASCDIVFAEDSSSARRLAEEHDSAMILTLGDDLTLAENAPLAQGAFRAMQSGSDGIGLVSSGGQLDWLNEALARKSQWTRSEFTRLCAEAIESFNAAKTPGNKPEGATREFALRSRNTQYQLVVAPAEIIPGDKPIVRSVVGLLWDLTANRRLQETLDAIDAAGNELMRIDADVVAPMPVAQRLKMLEQKIVRSVHDVLHFDNFEIRLRNPRTNQLELVIAVGISPLKIGEAIYAEPEGNGISGYVASTGRSYICPNVKEDPLYREGMEEAASSLTVPLRLQDTVIGVFNIESRQVNAFDDNDRQFAEIFGRYIAIALHILDLLVVERFTTNEQVAQNVLSELSTPLNDISTKARELRNRLEGDAHAQQALDAILNDISCVRERLVSCTSGPRNIIGVEQEMHREDVDPALAGKRILIADDEPAIRDTVLKLLTQKGCVVTACANGRQAIDLVEATKNNTGFDVVLTDISMPDCNGYEVFRSVKAKAPDTPVILMTGFGYDPHHCVFRASQEGLHSFLFKPFRASQLVDAISKAIANQTPPGI
jgi:CheY-like chemotaxis protein/PAS domain-containing protein